MSELKAYPAYNVYNRAHTLDKSLVYIKSEADKVIAELKSDIADLRDDKKLTDAILDERNAEIAELKKEKDYAIEYTTEALEAQEQELRHHKYKRCLAMSRWCNYWANYWEGCEPSDCGMFIARAKFYRRWLRSWLELADKFKEAK